MRPLLNDDPALPNAAYFGHIDAVVNAAAARGILILLVPTWGRWVNGAWAGRPTLFTEENARSFGAYVGKRYPGLPKVLGGDSNPIWTDVEEFRKRDKAAEDAGQPASLEGMERTNSSAVVDAMAEGILSSEPGAVITYHPTALALPGSPPHTASGFFGDRKWLTIDGCQSGHADEAKPLFEPGLQFWDARASHVPLKRMWGAGVRPIIDLENHCESGTSGMARASRPRANFRGELTADEGMRVGIRPSDKPYWSEHDVRAGAWQAVCAGVCGIVYGHNNVWQMHDPERERRASPFSQTLPRSWADHSRRPVHLGLLARPRPLVAGRPNLPRPAGHPPRCRVPRVPPLRDPREQGARPASPCVEHGAG